MVILFQRKSDCKISRLGISETKLVMSKSCIRPQKIPMKFQNFLDKGAEIPHVRFKLFSLKNLNIRNG